MAGICSTVWRGPRRFTVPSEAASMSKYSTVGSGLLVVVDMTTVL